MRVSGLKGGREDWRAEGLGEGTIEGLQTKGPHILKHLAIWPFTENVC